VEKVALQPVLKKIRLNGFGHLADSPKWLDIGIAILEMTDEGMLWASVSSNSTSYIMHFPCNL
jgi:hypothetical protein